MTTHENSLQTNTPLLFDLALVPLSVRYAEKPHYKIEAKWDLPRADLSNGAPTAEIQSRLFALDKERTRDAQE